MEKSNNLNLNTSSLVPPQLKTDLITTNNRQNEAGGVEQARKKILLGRGYSLMDWIRYSKETPDIAGNKGILRPITYEELALHNKENDCWMAIYDKVYNVTPYMKYHPGGVEELMKGAGKNATDLFNQVHQWVNIQSMLEKCLLGSLIGSPQITKDAKKENEISSEKSSVSSDSSTSINNLTKENADEIPVIDSYQSNYTCNIVFYTKCKNLKNDCLIIDKSTDPINPNFIITYLNTPYAIYKYILEIPAPVKNDYEIKVSKEGKVELVLYKSEYIHWWQMCPKLNFKAEIIKDARSGINFRVCELVKRVQVTRDTSLYCFKLPESSLMRVPVGYHVFLRLLNNEILVKPYTAIHESLLPDIIQDDGKQICLMIKHYENGSLTSELKKLENGSKVEISNYTGSFRQEMLLKCTDLYLICAGTGLTPITRVLISALKLNNIAKIKMLFFNKTVEDILWKKEIEEVAYKYPKFKICHVLSQAGDSWKGRKGKINTELLNELVRKNIEKPLFCICGPKQFTDLTKELLQIYGYSDEFIFPFLG